MFSSVINKPTPIKSNNPFVQRESFFAPSTNLSKSIQGKITIDNCNKEQKGLIKNSISLANAKVDAALNLVGKDTKLAKHALSKYFQDHSGYVRHNVLQGFHRMKNKLNSGFTIKCEENSSFLCQQGPAYTFPLFGDIHICHKGIVNEKKISNTIVHELSHLVHFTEDYEYCNCTLGCSSDLSIKQAIKNGNSYECFAAYAHHHLK